MTVQHKAGFELIQVRTGEKGTKKPYRFKDGPLPAFTVEAACEEFTTMFRRIDDEEGRTVRANFERLGQLMDGTWDEGQESRENMEAFLKRFVD